jgi:Tfp pilus assembly protein PilE
MKCKCEIFGRIGKRRGISLLELTIVTVIIGILVTMSLPSFQRGLEQSRADLAAANLRSIWSAQRLYWIDNRTYAVDLDTLAAAGLLDSAVSAQANYELEIIAADATTFAATATRSNNARWNGSFTIDQSGAVTGSLVADGMASIVPGYQ